MVSLKQIRYFKKNMALLAELYSYAEISNFIKPLFTDDVSSRRSTKVVSSQSIFNSIAADGM